MDLGGIIVFILAIGAYFLPAIVAASRDHKNGGPIVVLNFFLAWTIIGWIVCLAWAFSAQEE